METTLNKTAWREAATGGLWLGLALCLAMCLGYLGRTNASISFLATLLQLTALFFVPFFYARKMARLHGAAGYTYTQGLGFIFRLLLFAGVIAGLGQFILQSYVNPEYYREEMEKMFFAMNRPEEQLAMLIKAMSNPVFMILAGITSTVLYGGFLGLFVAVFTKRPADPFRNDTPGADPDQNA